MKRVRKKLADKRDRRQYKVVKNGKDYKSLDMADNAQNTKYTFPNTFQHYPLKLLIIVIDGLRTRNIAL